MISDHEKRAITHKLLNIVLNSKRLHSDEVRLKWQQVWKELGKDQDKMLAYLRSNHRPAVRYLGRMLANIADYTLDYKVKDIVYPYKRDKLRHMLRAVGITLP